MSLLPSPTRILARKPSSWFSHSSVACIMNIQSLYTIPDPPKGKGNSTKLLGTKILHDDVFSGPMTALCQSKAQQNCLIKPLECFCSRRQRSSDDCSLQCVHRRSCQLSGVAGMTWAELAQCSMELEPWLCTLSVSTIQRMSPEASSSPSFFFHSTMLPCIKEDSVN